MSASYWDEKWVPVYFEGISEDEKYEISNYGRIKSYKVNKKEGNLINGASLKGYKVLNIKLSNGKRTTKYIHKLVAENFLEKESPLQQHVIHLDFNKQNNYYKNLKWVTKETMFEHQKINQIGRAHV